MKNRIEFFHSSDLEDLEKEINDFLKNNFEKIVVVKRDMFFYGNDYTVSLLFKEGTSVTPEKVKFFSYDDSNDENEPQTEKAIKNFVSRKERVVDFLTYTYLPTQPSFENRPLIGATFGRSTNYRRISEHKLIAVFY